MVVIRIASPEDRGGSLGAEVTTFIAVGLGGSGTGDIVGWNVGMVVNDTPGVGELSVILGTFVDCAAYLL
jgi:hypothetical protein